MVLKGTWVEIESIVLDIEERAENIPEDTKKTPLKMWLKGYLLEDCDIFEEATIETVIGRIEKGKLVTVEPSFNHDFGRYVKELSYIGKDARELLRE